MNTNQLNLFKTENDCVPLLLYYLTDLTESCYRIKLPSSRRRWGKQPAKMSNFLGLAPSNPTSSIPAAYIMSFFLSNFHQD